MTTHTDTLTSATERLIAAEHLLAQHLPNMRTVDRVQLAIELRDLLDGAPKPKTTPCPACNGHGERLHGWAVCPAPCRDCEGTGQITVVTA